MYMYIHPPPDPYQWALPLEPQGCFALSPHDLLWRCLEYNVQPILKTQEQKMSFWVTPDDTF